MTDPLTPLLSSFALSPDEVLAIEAALASTDPWKHEAPNLATHKQCLKVLKDRLVALHLKRQKDKCCYCRKLIGGSGPFMRDREHILPKKKFKKLTWSVFNLSVACKRCNMSIKGQKTDFVVDLSTIEDDVKNADRYMIVHPNFDKWEDHLEVTHLQTNTGTLVHFKIISGSAKGTFTYEFFKLRELVVENLDGAQGNQSKQSVVKEMLKQLRKSYDQ